MYLCTYADCRVPHERHDICAAKGLSACWGNRLEHQHTPKRSRGGRDCWVRLCPGHHGDIDGGGRREGLRIADRIHDFREWGEERSGPPHRMYEIYERETGDILKSIRLEEPDTEGGDHQSSNLVNDEAEVPSSPPSVPGTSE